jgi:serine/threonine-protein kinase
MVDEERGDIVKLIDFGLSKVPVDQIATAEEEDDDDEGNKELTTVGIVFGTVAYMSPEAGLGMWAVDERSDLYALGIILYEMLAGRHPFDGTEPGELFYQQRSVMPSPIATRTPSVEVPPAVEAIVTCLVQKDPANRYANAQALIAAIDAAMPGVGEIIIPPERVSSGTGGTVPPPSSGRPARLRTPPPPATTERVAEALPAFPSPSGTPPIEIKEAGGNAPSSARAPSSAKTPVIKQSPTPAPAKPAPAKPAPAKPAPVKPAPVKPAPVKPAETKGSAAAKTSSTASKALPYASGASSATSAADAKSSLSTSAPALVRPSQPPGHPFVPLVPVRNRRSRGAGTWIVRGAALVVLLAVGGVFVWRTKGGFGGERPRPEVSNEAAPAVVGTDAHPSATPPAVSGAPSAVPAAGQADTAAQDGAALRARVRSSAEKKQWDAGAQAVVDLAKAEPAVVKETDVIAAAAAIAAGLDPAASDKLFEALATSAGTAGPDLLYEISAKSPESESGKRALDLLERKDVNEIASPALKVLLELRKAPCMKKALVFKKAKRDGDIRSVAFLEDLRSRDCNRKKGECCFPGNHVVDHTIRAINARLEKESK